MSYTGKVHEGVFVLPPGVQLPEGTVVKVEAIAPARTGNELTRRLMNIARKVEGLPDDLAAQHDHYLYGTPKR